MSSLFFVRSKEISLQPLTLNLFDRVSPALPNASSLTRPRHLPRTFNIFSSNMYYNLLLQTLLTNTQTGSRLSESTTAWLLGEI